MQTELLIKDIDSALISGLALKAQKNGADLNTYLISIIKSIVYFDDEPREYDDLDYLAGTWAKEECEEFNKNIAFFNLVDATLWQ